MDDPELQLTTARETMCARTYRPYKLTLSSRSADLCRERRRGRPLSAPVPRPFCKYESSSCLNHRPTFYATAGGRGVGRRGCEQNRGWNAPPRGSWLGPVTQPGGGAREAVTKCTNVHVRRNAKSKRTGFGGW